VSLQYDDFDLQITPLPGGKYRVHLNAPSGQTSGDFLLPFTDVDFGNFLGRIGQVRRSTRRSDGPELNAAKEFGGKLFNAVFSGEMIAQLRSSMEQTLERDRGLRIRLRLTDAPELADLPWEFLYDSAQNHFLTTSVETPVVRFLDLPQKITPLRASLPLRVLVMIAGPRNLKRLDAEGEWERLQDALGDLLRSGQIVLERLPAATLNALRLRARGAPFHIFHFIGHGGFDQQAQDGVLQFEDETGMSHPVRGELLGMQLHDHRSLRLAVLNACEGARSSRRDPFSGVAQSLLQQRVPAVIAMQFEISDLAAKTFAREFYCAIAEGNPVDAAVCESRKALFNEEFGQEWATPVLYMRSHEGTLFELAPAGAASGATGTVASGTPPVVPGSSEHIVADAARKAAELAEATRAAEAARVAEAERVSETARVAEAAAARERAEKERAELARIESAKADAERRRLEAEKAAAAEREAREAERAATAASRDAMGSVAQTEHKTKKAFPVWQVGAGVVIFGLLFALSWHHLRPHSHSDEENGAAATNSLQGAGSQPAPVAPTSPQNGNAANGTAADESAASGKRGDSAHAKKARDGSRGNDGTPSSDASANKSANAGNNAGASTPVNPAASGSASSVGTNSVSASPGGTSSGASGGATSSASTASAATPLRVSATDQEAKVIKRVGPVYPAQAAQNHISGMVVLDVVIAKDGTVKSVSPTSGDAALTGSAMDAVKQRRYQPTLVDGQPVEVETTVSVNYSIKDSPSGGAAAVAGAGATGAVATNSVQPAPCTLGNVAFKENGTMIVGTVPYAYSGSAALQTLAVVGFPVGSDKKRIQGVTLAETTLQSASGTASFSMESHPSLNGGGTTGEYVEVVMIVKATGQPLCGKTVPYLRNW
jgi:TonB family protein